MKIYKAVAIAKKSALDSNMKFRFGAVLFDSHNFVVGFNRKFHVRHLNRHKPFSIHAEEMSILKASRIIDFNFNNSTLVIVRINNKGKLMPCTPCSYCQAMIKKFNIGTIYFSV